MKLRPILFIGLLASMFTPLALAQGQTPTPSTRDGCTFAWYWRQSLRNVHSNIDNVDESLRQQVYANILAHESNTLSPIVTTPSAFWCVRAGNSNYYRFLSAAEGIPWLRAEIFCPDTGNFSLPSAQDSGWQFFAAWLTDPDPSCAETSRFRARSHPRYTLNAYGVSGVDGALESIVTASMKERFAVCTGANNEIEHRFVLTHQGPQSAVSYSFGIPATLSFGVTTNSGQTPGGPWSKNETFRGPLKYTGPVKATADSMTLTGWIQSQLSAHASLSSSGAPSVLHTSIYAATHDSALQWTARRTPGGTPATTPTPAPPPPPGGGTTVSPGGGTTPPPGGGGTTPPAGGSPAPIPTTPFPAPRPPNGIMPPPNTLPGPVGGGIDGGFTLHAEGRLQPLPVREHPIELVPPSSAVVTSPTPQAVPFGGFEPEAQRD